MIIWRTSLQKSFSLFCMTLLFSWATSLFSEHHMCWTVSMISDLWREWMLDWNSFSVIQDFKMMYEVKWWLSQQKRIFFNRRKVIIDKIHQWTQLNQFSDAVVKELKLVQRRLKVSLHKLWSWLNKKSWLSAVY